VSGGTGRRCGEPVGRSSRNGADRGALNTRPGLRLPSRRHGPGRRTGRSCLGRVGRCRGHRPTGDRLVRRARRGRGATPGEQLGRYKRGGRRRRRLRIRRLLVRPGSRLHRLRRSRSFRQRRRPGSRWRRCSGSRRGRCGQRRRRRRRGGSRGRCGDSRWRRSGGHRRGARCLRDLQRLGSRLLGDELGLRLLRRPFRFRQGQTLSLYGHPRYACGAICPNRRSPCCSVQPGGSG